MISATLLHHGPRMARPGWLAAAGGIGFIGACIADEITAGHIDPMWHHMAYGLTGGICVFGLTRYEQTHSLKPRGLIMRLGDASYALYLIHFPLIAVLSKLAMRMPLHGPGGATATFVVMIVVCVAASMAFHRWVERPMLRWLRPRPALAH